MKKITLILILIALNSCSKNCKYDKATLDKNLAADIKAAGSNWQKIDIINQVYKLKVKEAC